ncbi:MAG: PQQ-binding-like beta-propeller repeat protein [Elusimicrobiota bacterium]|nr:PQQ-binding-like beta-propeller repeat protein [Endomicrobiia bacterium]MDW8165167.1 PQQ-binding-like beta-propeller repeat protein [Elusimicrobiota bacterium]
MFLRSKIYIFIITFLIFKNNFYSASWQNFRFNKTRTGSKQEIIIPSEIPLGWSLEIQGEVVGSCVVKDDVVFFAARDFSCWALDAKSGDVLWQYSTSGKIDATPTVWKNYVYVLSYDGKLYCFKRNYREDEDCVPLWTYDTQSKSASSLLVVDEEEIVGEDAWLIFVSGPKLNGTPQGYLYILKAKNGELINKIPIEGFSYSSLSYDEGRIYFTSNTGKIYCYDLKQNRFIWQRNLRSCFYFTSIVVADNLYLYAGDIERKIYILDKNTSDIIWSSYELSNVATDNTSICVYKDKIIVNIYPSSLWEVQPQVVYSSQTVLCISTSTKQILWRKDFFVNFSPKNSYNFTSAPTVVGNIVFFGTYSGKLYALDIETAEIISQYDFSSPIVASVVVANGWLYFGETKGKFYGIKADKFLSIKSPDEEDVVVNFTTITILSKNYENKRFSLECINLKNNNCEIISSSTIVSDSIKIFWDTRNFPDGKYMLKLKISSTEYVENTITIDNSPLAPTNISAVIYQKTKVLLTWTRSLDDLAGNKDVKRYIIYYSTDNINYKLLDYVLSGVSFYIHTPLFFGCSYYYRITSQDKHSESIFSPPKVVYMPSMTKPYSPKNLKVENYLPFISSGVIKLVWEVPLELSYDIVKFNLYRKTTGEFILYDSISFNNTSSYYYLDTVSLYTSYYYFVKAVNYYDVESDTSNIVYFYPFGVSKPLGVRDFVVFDTPNDNGGSLSLKWLYSFDEFSLVSKVVNYKIYKSTNNLDFFLVDIIYDLGKTTYTYIDINCPVGVTFYYYITSVNQHSLESEPSEIRYSYSVKDAIEVDTTPPKAPFFITALDYPNDDGKKIILMWSLSEDDLQGQNDVIKYNIYKSSQVNIYPLLFYQVPSGTSWYIDTDIVLGVTYYYFITALDRFYNESVNTQIVSVFSKADGVPAAVKIFKAEQTYLDTLAVLLLWEKSADDGGGFDDVVFYQIYRSTDSFVYNLISQVNKSTTYFLDTQCEPDQLYYYYIVAVDKDGYVSQKSNIVSILTFFEVLLKPEKDYIIEYKKFNRKLELIVQSNSILKEVKIRIQNITSFPNFPEYIKPTNLVYEFLPDDLRFKKPAKLKIYYLNEDIKQLKEENLRIVWYDKSSSLWRILDSSKVNIEKNYIEAEIYHFSLYALAEYTSIYLDAVKEEYVYTFPSPAKGDEIYFKFLLYQPAQIKIYVYDIAGDIVWQSKVYDFNQQHTGKTHTIKWNIKNLATGTYLFRLEAKTERSTKNVIKKFAVIH